MIMGEEDGGWPGDDIKKQVFLQSETVFKYHLLFDQSLCFLSQVFH